MFHAGILLRVRKTALVSYAMIANLALSVVAVVGLLPVPFIRERPILLPVLAIYAGILVQFGITVWGAYRYREQAVCAGLRPPPQTSRLRPYRWATSRASSGRLP